MSLGDRHAAWITRRISAYSSGRAKRWGEVDREIWIEIIGEATEERGVRLRFLEFDRTTLIAEVPVSCLRTVKDSSRYFSLRIPGDQVTNDIYYGIAFNTRDDSKSFLRSLVILKGQRIERSPFADYDDRESFWMSLSDELFIQIFQHLDLIDLVHVSQTCVRWRNIAHDNILWRSLYEEAFFTFRGPTNHWRDMYIQRYIYRNQRLRLSSNSDLLQRRQRHIPTNPRKPTRPIKLVALGDHMNSEKAILLMSYANDRYPGDEEYVPTVFDNYVVPIEMDDVIIELGLWDTSGAEEYDRLRPLSYANANVILLVFSVVQPSTLEHISSKWFPEVSHFCPDVPKILVGTQIELRHDPETLHALAEQGKHPVTREQAELVAREIKATAYMECSSRTGENLREVFEEAVRAVLVFQPDRSNRCTIS